MNLLWRWWMGLRYSGICWKHREEMTSNYSGMFCRSCDQEWWQRHEAKDKYLRQKYGVAAHHGESAKEGQP